jgi:hypothetical protein
VVDDVRLDALALDVALHQLKKQARLAWKAGSERLRRSHRVGPGRDSTPESIQSTIGLIMNQSIRTMHVIAEINGRATCAALLEENH